MSPRSPTRPDAGPTAGARRRSASAPDPAPWADGVPELDPILHERHRFGMVAVLSGGRTLAFAELKRILRTTDGNLSVHARRLETAGYVTCSKSFAGRTPRSEYRLTSDGRRALEHYVGQLDRLISVVRGR